MALGVPENVIVAGFPLHTGALLVMEAVGKPFTDTVAVVLMVLLHVPNATLTKV